jgi:hypothetical protein
VDFRVTISPMNTPFGPLASYNAVDLALVVIALLGAWSGWRRSATRASEASTPVETRTIAMKTARRRPAC